MTPCGLAMLNTRLVATQCGCPLSPGSILSEKLVHVSMAEHMSASCWWWYLIDIACCFPTLRNFPLSLSHMNQFMDVQMPWDIVEQYWKASRRWSNLANTFFQLGGLTITIYIVYRANQPFTSGWYNWCFLKRFLPKKIVSQRCFLEIDFLRPQNSAHVFVVPKTHHATVQWKQPEKTETVVFFSRWTTFFGGVVVCL